MSKSNPSRIRISLCTFGWWSFAVLIALCVILYFWCISQVPFHPDESTYLYMSGDFDLLLRDPFSMAWSQNREDDSKQRYRELDAPLTKYILGLGRTIARIPAPSVDWDWGKTWEKNDSAGALPSHHHLQIGRLSIALLFPLSLYFLFHTGKLMNGNLTGALAAIFLATNSLILLHTRRAMAEGTLIFAISFALWSFMYGYQYPWLAGLGMAVALNAKYSTLALFPVGLIAVLWLPKQQSKPIIHRAYAVLQYVGMIILVTLALNPLLWKEPIQAAKAAWAARQDLLQQQVEDVNRLAPEKVLESAAQRVGVLIYNIYLGEPMFAEVENYISETAAIEKAYLKNPFHQLLRNPVGAGILLILTLFGFSLALLKIFKGNVEQSRYLILVMLSTIVQVLAILWVIPLPWQRYSLPILPFVFLWTAFGFARLGDKIRRTLSKNYPSIIET